MIRIIPFLTIGIVSPIALAADDLIRLSEGELRGQFEGIDQEGIVSWSHDEGLEPVRFREEKVRQIILRAGTTMRPDASTSHITLTNGDRIPARIVSLDEDTLTIDSLMAGQLEIPRKFIASMSPNPYGGRLLYAGPFSEKDWELVPENDEETEREESETTEAEEETDRKASWRHVASRWYFTGGHDVIRRNVGLSDQSLLRFTAEWRARPAISIAINADFQDQPQPDEALEDEDGENAPPRRGPHRRAQAFGNSLLLVLRSSYAQLIRTGYDDDGEPTHKDIRASSNNIRLENTETSNIELRLNRRAMTLSLYINGRFGVRWNLEDALLGEEKTLFKGDGIGFSTPDPQTPMRLSNIVVAEWNGMPDSAESLNHPDRDIILMTNGTDRFSGELSAIEDKHAVIQGPYAELRVPLDGISDIQFALETQDTPEEQSDNLTHIRFQPLGSLSGKVGTATKDRLKLASPLVGPLDIDLSSAVVIEFMSGNSFLNYWDEDL